MKKILLATALIFLFNQLALAELYVAFDRETGEIKGVTSVSEEHVLDWTKKCILRKPDNPEEFRGKHRWEIRYEDGKLRLATEQEIADYLALREQEQQQAVEAKEKQKFLDWLEDEDVETKIKEIKDAEPIMMGTERNWKGRIKDKIGRIYEAIKSNN